MSQLRRFHEKVSGQGKLVIARDKHRTAQSRVKKSAPQEVSMAQETKLWTGNHHYHHSLYDSRELISYPQDKKFGVFKNSSYVI